MLYFILASIAFCIYAQSKTSHEEAAYSTKNKDGMFKTNTKYSPVLEEKEYESYKDEESREMSYQPSQIFSNVEKRTLINDRSIDVNDAAINIEWGWEVVCNFLNMNMLHQWKWIIKR